MGASRAEHHNENCSGQLERCLLWLCILWAASETATYLSISELSKLALEVLRTLSESNLRMCPENTTSSIQIIYILPFTAIKNNRGKQVH